MAAAPTPLRGVISSQLCCKHQQINKIDVDGDGTIGKLRCCNPRASETLSRARDPRSHVRSRVRLTQTLKSTCRQVGSFGMLPSAVWQHVMSGSVVVPPDDVHANAHGRF